MRPFGVVIDSSMINLPEYRVHKKALHSPDTNTPKCCINRYNCFTLILTRHASHFSHNYTQWFKPYRGYVGDDFWTWKINIFTLSISIGITFIARTPKRGNHIPKILSCFKFIWNYYYLCKILKLWIYKTENCSHLEIEQLKMRLCLIICPPT